MLMRLRSQSVDCFWRNTIRGFSRINSVFRTATVFFQSSVVPLVFTQSPSGLYQKLVAVKNAGGTDAPNIEIARPGGVFTS